MQSRISAVRRKHKRFAVSRRKAIGKKIRAAGLDDVLKQMLQKHEQKVKKLADQAPATAEGVKQLQQKADKIKKGVDAKFQKKKSALQKSLEAVKLKTRKKQPKQKQQSAFEKAIKSKKLRKTFKKEDRRKDHLDRLKTDKKYYKEHFDYRRKKYAKK